MSDEVMPTIQCDNCSAEIAEDEALYTENDTHVCDMCAVYCNRCDNTFDQNESMNYVDNQLWCQSCTGCANWCDSCNEYTEDSTYYISDRGESWCPSCSDGYAIYCEGCDSYYASGCDDCVDTRHIHDWSYKPDPIFHSVNSDERLFFGIEIEMEAEGSSDLQLASEYAVVLEEEELAYLKNDGSLDCGMELVTHPMSYDFYSDHADELWDRLEKLRTSYSMRSGDTRTCGLHVHISRSGFSGGAHMHRFLNLVYSNPRFYSIMAGRESDRWATFDDVITAGRNNDGEYKQYKTFKRKIMDGRSTNRYSAVNTQNQHTLEMRIFKGSMRKHTVMAQIGLAHASVEYTRSLSMRDIANGALDANRFMEYIRDNADLYPYTVARMDLKADALQPLQPTVR